MRHSADGATTDASKDRNTGDRREETEWHRVVMFSRLAEIAGECLRKGRLSARKWQNREGQDQYITEIMVEQMQMLGGRDDRDESQADTGDKSLRPGSESSCYKPVSDFSDEPPLRGGLNFRKQQFVLLIVLGHGSHKSGQSIVNLN